MANGARRRRGQRQKVFLNSSVFPLGRFSGEYVDGGCGRSFSLE